MTPSPALFRTLSLALVLLGIAPLALGGPAGRSADRRGAVQPITERHVSGAIRYTLRFPAAHTHYVEVTADLPADGRAAIDVMMAVWTPGSYLVREYARHVEGVAATAPDGAPLAVRKSSKNRWRIDTAGASRVTLTYRVYAREMSVRTNWVERDFAILNGAPTFITVADRLERPHHVSLELPAHWPRSATALQPDSGAAPGTVAYVAPDFDTLVDSPIVAGAVSVVDFDVDGVPHQLATVGDPLGFDEQRAVADISSIVQENRRLWGSLPYDRYVFLNAVVEAGGGLEHGDSTLMMSSRWRLATPEGYRRWLGLVSHEYFHAWNVKRLRPVELGPFDYEREVHTSGLYIAEGFTSYYGPLLLVRAGLWEPRGLLDSLGRTIGTVQATPGRLATSVADASFDSWIRQYRPDENSGNVSIDYYGKGALVAFLLDAHVRTRTGGRRSLDDVMRRAFAGYSGARGYSQEEFRAVAGEVAGADLSTWFRRVVDEPTELDYREALEWFGLRFPPASGPTGRAWLGADTRDEGGRLVVSRVRRDGPAFAAGLNVGDEIVGLNGYRVRPADLASRLQLASPGERVRLLIARRDRLEELDVEVAGEPDASRWRLELDPEATAALKAHREAWLGGDTVTGRSP